MNTFNKKIINHFSSVPKVVFLIDSIGAFLTSFLLFAVLRNFNEYFGMPRNILTGLSALAAVFFLYSISCFLFLKNSWAVFIRTISIANILYCMLTLGLVVIYYNQLTIIAVAYFIGEVAIVFALVYFELAIASAIKQKVSF